MSAPAGEDPNPEYPKFPLMSAMFGAPKPADTATVIPSEAASLAEIAKQLHIRNLIAYASHRVDHNDATAARNAPALVKILADIDFRIREELGL